MAKFSGKERITADGQLISEKRIYKITLNEAEIGLVEAALSEYRYSGLLFNEGVLKKLRRRLKKAYKRGEEGLPYIHCPHCPRKWPLDRTYVEPLERHLKTQHDVGESAIDEAWGLYYEAIKKR